MKDSIKAASDYLLDHSVLCLATCDDNVPWVSPVFYTVFNSQLLFLSAPHTRHCKSMARNSAVAGSIQQDYSDWTAIKGIQLRGHVSMVAQSGRAAAISAYSEKFPITGNSAPQEIANALDKIAWFTLAIEELLFIDNSKGLGHRVALDPQSVLSIGSGS